MWREDPDEVRSCVGYAIATGQRTEWVLSKELRRRKPVGRGRARQHGSAPELAEWDGRVADGVGAVGSTAGVRHLVEWADPTGETASTRVDASAVLEAAEPVRAQVLWAWASGATLAEIASATGRPVHWVENVLFPRAGRPSVVAVVGRRSAAEARRAALLEAVVSGVARGRSVRAVAREQCCSDSHLGRLWREHTAAERGAA